MIRRSIQLARFIARQSNLKQLYYSCNQTNLTMIPQAQFGFFSNIFLSSDQKKLNKLRQQLHEVSIVEGVNIMKDIIKSNEQMKKREDYDNSDYDQLMLAEYLHKSGRVDESNVIFNKLEKQTKIINQNELIARKLQLNPQNAKLKAELEKAISQPTQTIHYSLPYCQMVLASYYLSDQNIPKCEEFLKKASENIDNLLKSEESKVSYERGCKQYVRMLISVKQMEVLYKQRNFDEMNKQLESAFNSWKIIEDNHYSVLGYAINKLNPAFLSIMDNQIRIVEFFQDYSSAIDFYSNIINLYEVTHQSNAQQIIKLKLKQLNCLIHEKEFSDSSRLLKELSKTIEQFQPENHVLIAEHKMLEIQYLHKNNKLSNINEKINEAASYCLAHKVIDISYARILITFLNLNSEKGSQECLPIINSVEILLKQIKEVPVYILADYYLSSARYLLTQKDSQNVSKYFRSCINILKSPPPQVYSVIRTYYIWIGYLFELNHIEEAKQLIKEGKEYKDLSNDLTPSQQYSVSVLFLEIDEKLKQIEFSKKV